MEKGDVVRVEYEIWIKNPEGNVLYATNIEELAKKHNIYDENSRYGPEPFIIGVKRILEPVDEKLLEANVGDTIEVEVPPEKAFGRRNPNLIEKVPLREFRKQGKTPMPGDRVVINGRVGTVIDIAAGRVIVDFNHPLADKTLIYKVRVVEKIEDPIQKVKAIIEMDYPKDIDEFEIRAEGSKVTIKLPDRCKYDNDWERVKLFVASNILNYSGFTELDFVEHYEKPKKEAVKSDNKQEEQKEEKSKGSEKS